ncbi:protein-glutamate methylesterase/protein-glutamine glutaminase [Phreatobacter oligotrophus]|jgi:two-component system, chemotaxis family, protein-glutamate methylesterase/glutaminase|uniref:protein-glutamate methylesterase/protein-glutamine glutaminase n=1 Tax=Phreatobacter oligotrophus TaxID=1122261 RepID=UPI0023531CAB|nr:chemotaxis response regulator protein-glutamate methylesterase [Phreatobacter oligotrophus]MBX9990633.1 chemotaxis response regulator protein-glutamate methylesterase [Phreatobacter oligotrophus]
MSLASFKAASSSPPPSPTDPIKVMVVDDAVVVRGLVGRWISEETDMKLVASHRSGREAVADIAKVNPDVVILDIEMPDMDGITALPLIIQAKRDVMVLMASTLTRRNAEISLKCLSLGAADYVPKPETNAGVTTSPAFKREILDKVRALGRRRKISGRAFRAASPAGSPAAAAAPRVSSPSIAPQSVGFNDSGFKLRAMGTTIPKVLLIGSSTGGPQALTTVLKALGSFIDRVPVLITQHMPPTFTTILAEHAAKASGRPAAEGRDGEPIQAGRIYVAPGGKHMVVRKTGGTNVIHLEDGPPINFCKPAVDPLFTSAAQAWGAQTFGCVLTGMGHDGAHGAGDIVAAGGSVIAQDEATSVVWGMPGAVAQAGHACAVLPIDQIAPKIMRVFSGDRS